ncbi:MAG: pyridoxal 5'-phosphate synthase glutaminase subunit PdxT [Anaerolineales bacterium]|jgi:5'-phosphate synthase pdxT subunit
MKIGVLALQGDFSEHVSKLSCIGVSPVEVRLPSDLEGLSGAILPGGESTTFRKLAASYGLIEPLRAFGKNHGLWGTCAGAIALAKHIGGEDPILGLMDITIERNAFGRQVDSFETDLDIPALSSPNLDSHRLFHGVFIRSPMIQKTGPGVEILARLSDGTIVAARQRRWLATCFHPELVDDDRLYRLFQNMIALS